MKAGNHRKVTRDDLNADHIGSVVRESWQRAFYTIIGCEDT